VINDDKFLLLLLRGSGNHAENRKQNRLQLIKIKERIEGSFFTEYKNGSRSLIKGSFSV
jgi:hypothetical protein